MNPIAVGLLIAGGTVTVLGILTAALAFESIHLPLLIATVVVGGALEGAGVLLIMQNRR